MPSTATATASTHVAVAEKAKLRRATCPVPRALPNPMGYYGDAVFRIATSHGCWRVGVAATSTGILGAVWYGSRGSFWSHFQLRRPNGSKQLLFTVGAPKNALRGEEREGGSRKRVASPVSHKLLWAQRSTKGSFAPTAPCGHGVAAVRARDAVSPSAASARPPGAARGEEEGRRRSSGRGGSDAVGAEPGAAAAVRGSARNRMRSCVGKRNRGATTGKKR